MFAIFDEKKNKDFLCVTVMSKDSHSLLTVIASVAETAQLRTVVWSSFASLQIIATLIVIFLGISAGAVNISG